MLHTLHFCFSLIVNMDDGKIMKLAKIGISLHLVFNIYELSMV